MCSAPAFAGAYVSRSAFRFTQGKPKFYKSSPIVERGLCADCGSYLIYKPLIAEWSDWIIVPIACLDHPENFPPEQHYGTEDQVKWFNTRDDLPRERYEENFIEILSGEDCEARRAILERFG